MRLFELPTATSSIRSSTIRIALAVSAASRPYSAADLLAHLPWPIELVAQAPQPNAVGVGVAVALRRSER